MKHLFNIIKILFFGIFCSFIFSESLGNLAQYPPEIKEITISSDIDGLPKLEPNQVSLFTGKYYRLNINCEDVKDDLDGWRIEIADLLRNSH